jgi:hypothetical protein
MSFMTGLSASVPDERDDDDQSDDQGDQAGRIHADASRKE